MCIRTHCNENIYYRFPSLCVLVCWISLAVLADLIGFRVFRCLQCMFVSSPLCSALKWWLWQWSHPFVVRKDEAVRLQRSTIDMCTTLLFYILSIFSILFSKLNLMYFLQMGRCGWTHHSQWTGAGMPYSKQGLV